MGKESGEYLQHAGTLKEFTITTASSAREIVAEEGLERQTQERMGHKGPCEMLK